MGNRANIFLVDDRETDPAAPRGIYAYTHWNGDLWPEALRRALASDIARRRWSDPSYLSRIIVSTIFEDCHGSDLGGGLSTRITDNEHPIIVVDLEREMVWFAEPGDERAPDYWYAGKSFADFVALTEAGYPPKVHQ